MKDRLATVEENGRPVHSRFSDPVALRNTYDKLTEEDAKEAERRAKLRRMYDAHLPFNPAELRQSGLKHVTNVNWLGLKSVIDNRADTLLKLSSDTTNLIELQPRARELAGPDAQRIARVISEEFSTMLRETGDVIPALAMMNTEADMYGLGPLTWTSSLDYKPVALERGQIRFLGTGPIQSSRHELVMYETVMPAAYLFFLLDHEDVASAEGWNVAQVKKWLVDVFRNHVDTLAQPGAENNTSYVETALSMLRQNRFIEEHQFEQMNVIHAFVREMEFPRGITHYIMPATEQKDYLFVKHDAYKTMDECFLWFPYAVNKRFAREVRGLASHLFPIEAANNRYKCRVMDMALHYASLMFSNTTTGNQQALTLNEQGPFTVVPKELTPVQSNVKPDMQQVMAMSQYIDNMGVNSVTGGDKAPVSTTGFKMFQGSDRQTKEEVLLQQKLRSHKEEALFVQRMSVLDKVFRETYRRVFRLVKLFSQHDPTIAVDYPEIVRFIQNCDMRSVPIDLLLSSADAFNVVTCRDLVLGSDGKVGVLTDLLGNFGANLDEPGRKNAQRDWIQLRLGVQSADRYLPEVDRDNAPSDQASFATVENNSMRQGMEVMAGSDQLHWAHIPIHAKVLQEIVETVAAPGDNDPSAADDGTIAQKTLEATQNNPRQVLQLLVACSKHIQEHLQYGAIQIGMEGRAKQVKKMLSDLRPTIKSLNLAVATQERVEQAERERQQREMEDLQRRADENDVRKAQAEADKKAEVARYKVDLDHDVALRRLELERELAAARGGIMADSAAADRARRDADTAARIEREQRLADAKTNAAHAVGRMNAVQQGTGAGQVFPSDLTPQEPAPDAYESL